jgi:hypothetical protein
MFKYKVAYNEGAKTARILPADGELPEGYVEAGEFESTTSGPNPTDVSIQQIHNLLYRAGIQNPGQVTVERAPISEAIEAQEVDQAEEIQTGIADQVIPENIVLTVGESTDLVNGSTRSYTFEVDTNGDDGDVVKLDKRNAKVTALAAGTAKITVTKDGNANEVVITVREAAAPEGAEGNQTGSDAGEAASA